MALYYSVLDFQASTLEYLNSRFAVTTLPDPSFDSAEVLQQTEIVFVPMGWVFDGAKMAQCPRLVAIGSPTTGVPHIDAEYAARMGISICSLRDQQRFLATITPTAELAWGMILATVRRIPWAFDSVCEHRWDGKSFGRRTPRMLSNMTLGVIGLGRLGSLTARYGHAFGMNVFYYDPYCDDAPYQRCSTLTSLAEESDIVSIHVHATPETENMIDHDFLRSMKRGSYFINTARGSLVDEKALLDALKSGYLAGAALDTLREEHLPGFKESLSHHPLLEYARNHDNLVLTPHYGGATRDAWEKTERRIIDMILQELEKRGVQ